MPKQETLYVNTALSASILAVQADRPTAWPAPIHNLGLTIDWPRLANFQHGSPTMRQCQALGVTCFCVKIPVKKSAEKLA